jgi:hypothetical protein
MAGNSAMAMREPLVETSAPARIAKAIVTANKTHGPSHCGIDVLWKLYYATNHTLSRVELEQEFGVLDNRFGLFCRHVALELGAVDPDPLALVDAAPAEDGRQLLTLKPSVVAAIRFHAFSK